jgi:hypothetical protein
MLLWKSSDPMHPKNASSHPAPAESSHKLASSCQPPPIKPATVLIDPVVGNHYTRCTMLQRVVPCNMPKAPSQCVSRWLSKEQDRHYPRHYESPPQLPVKPRVLNSIRGSVSFPRVTSCMWPRIQQSPPRAKAHAESRPGLPGRSCAFRQSTRTRNACPTSTNSMTGKVVASRGVLHVMPSVRYLVAAASISVASDPHFPAPIMLYPLCGEIRLNEHTHTAPSSVGTKPRE